MSQFAKRFGFISLAVNAIGTTAVAAGTQIKNGVTSGQTFNRRSCPCRPSIAFGLLQSTPLPAATPLPIPTPTAFAQSNEFHYGRAPDNTYAAPSDPPQIFYALFSPTVLKNRTQVIVSVITTTNIARVTIGYGGYVVPLGQVDPEKWQSAFAFNAASFPFGVPNVSLALSAYRIDGTAATIQIPVSISP